MGLQQFLVLDGLSWLLVVMVGEWHSGPPTDRVVSARATDSLQYIMLYIHVSTYIL
jgi:hypothetical protein